jgi:serine/threonine-protein kinase
MANGKERLAAQLTPGSITQNHRRVAGSKASLEPGTVLQGTYEIVRPVGSGGMGEVYEARHARLPGRFAVKVLTARVAVGSSDFLRFRREAEIASSLRHPHIVQVVDFNQAPDGAPYIVMEFLEGSDLGAVLERDKPLPAARVAALVEQVASALAAAHGQGVVHRDLKPQNVFLVPVQGQGREYAKVVDFGISKVKTALSLTGEARMLGTPQYMAPEQAEGHADAVDGRTDQFALAVITYEMLSGRPPFSADSVPALLYRIANQAPPALAGAIDGIGPVVDAVLSRALAKDKGQRYTTVLEFATALHTALTGRASARMSPNTTQRQLVAVGGRRRGRALRVGALLVVMFAAAAIFALARRQRPALTLAPPVPSQAAPAARPLPTPAPARQAAAPAPPAPAPAPERASDPPPERPRRARRSVETSTPATRPEGRSKSDGFIVDF